MSATPSTTPAPNLPQRTLAPAKPDGRVAFVSGGTRGIGAAIWHSSMGQGATVAAGYSRDREKAESCSAELSERGGQGSVHTARAAARCGQEALRSRCTQCAPTRERRRSAWRPDEGPRSRPESPLVRTRERSVNPSVTNCQARLSNAQQGVT